MAAAVAVKAGDGLQVGFQSRAGGPIPSLEASIRAQVIYDVNLQPVVQNAVYA